LRSYVMSIPVMNMVWKYFNRGGSVKLIMLAMADYSDDLGGSLYPSISAIAKKTNVSESQARRIIHGLINEGYFTVIANEYGGHKGQSRHYKFNLELLCTPSIDATPCISATPSIDARKPLAPVRTTPGMDATLTTIEPPIEPSISTATQNIELPIPDFIDKDLWESFLDLRKSIKAKNSPIAVKALITELKKLRDAGHNPVEVINQSIRSSWKDVYPLKNNFVSTNVRSQSTGQKRSETANEMFKMFNQEGENGRIIDVSDCR